ncbi:MAG TPA: hypothetical protein VJO12_01460, partial [Stellaceae bacterium]|nr:hypothetical protein [Stellaceae bacterium]
MKKAAGGSPPAADERRPLCAYFEPPDPLDEAPPEAPPALGVLLGDDAPDEDEPPALGALPDELAPLDGEVDDPELPDGLVAELLP